MMNILAIFLVITSIAAGGIFSPPAEKKNHRNDDLILKEGHRLIVVEYEKETKGFTNHQPQQHLHESPRGRHNQHHDDGEEDKPLEHGLSSSSSMLGRANEKLKHAMPDLSRAGITSESLSDAYGRSKDAVDETLCRAKECMGYKRHLAAVAARGLQHTAQGVKGKAVDICNSGTYREAIDDIKDTAVEKVGKIPETIVGAKEAVGDSQMSRSLGETLGEAVGDSATAKTIHGGVNQAKEKVVGKTREFGEIVEGSGAAEVVTRRIPEAAHHARDEVAGKAHDLKEAVGDSDGLVLAKGKVSETAHNVKDAFEGAGETAAGYVKGMPETLSRAKDTGSEKVHGAKEAFEDAGETTAGYVKGMPETLSQSGVKVSDKARSVKEAFEDAKGTAAESIPEAIGEAKESATEKAKRLPETVNHAKESILDKARDLKQPAKEFPADEKEKALQDSEGLIKMAKDRILNTAHEIKEGAGDVKESVKGFVTVDLKEKVRMTESAITDNRSSHRKITMLFKEGTRNFTNVFRRGWEMAVSDQNVEWGLRVIRLAGYGTAYGSSVWVSFVSSQVLARVLPRQQFAAVQSKMYPVYFRLVGCSIGASMVAQILTRRYQSAQTKSQKGEKAHAYDLGMALVFVLVNLLFLEPRATKVMLEKMKWEKEEGRGIHGPSETQVSSRARTQVTSRARTAVGEELTEELVTERSHEEEIEMQARGRANSELEQLNRRLKRLNRYSAFFNILTIMTLTWHITFLARCLYVSC